MPLLSCQLSLQRPHGRPSQVPVNRNIETWADVVASKSLSSLTYLSEDGCKAVEVLAGGRLLGVQVVDEDGGAEPGAVQAVAQLALHPCTALSHCLMFPAAAQPSQTGQS